MKNFRKVDLPYFDIATELKAMIMDEKLSWDSMDQICLNTTADGDDTFEYGTGSLTKDWNNVERVQNEDGSISQSVPFRNPILNERDFTQLVSVFKNTVFEEIYNTIQDNFTTGRVRLMQSHPQFCMSWHDDASPRLHYPVKTQEGCLMVIGDEVMHLPQDEWWVTDTTNYHTALNSSNESRIHLVAAIFE